jgi:hypothetical protein
VAGADEARRLCDDLGMKPTTVRLPAWWTSPHDHVPIPGSGRGEIGDGEEVIVARELEEEDKKEVAEECKNSDNSGNDGNDDEDADDEDDDAMDEAVQAIGAAADLMMDASAEVAGEEESHPQRRAKIISTMEVPNIGAVHKHKVLMWLNGEVRTLSADRNRRVQQTVVTTAAQSAQLHQLSEHDWWVGTGDDIAVLFEEGDIKTFHIGRVVKMRRLNKGRRGSVQYRRKVLIHEDRADLEGLQLHLHWYSPCAAPPGQPRLVYKYNHIDPNPVDVATVICPCALVYEADNDTYTMQTATYEVRLSPHPSLARYVI